MFINVEFICYSLSNGINFIGFVFVFLFVIYGDIIVGISRWWC